MHIQRSIEAQIAARFFSGKAIVIFGARQTGKTTLVGRLVGSYGSDVLFINGDEPDTNSTFSTIATPRLKAIIGSRKFVVIDEAQRISEIGLLIKRIVDQIPEVQVIATGSSSLDLADKTSEPLTGRKFEYSLFPFSFRELADHADALTEIRMLPHRLVYGSYPEVVLAGKGQEAERLKLLSGSYLYKDLLMLESVKKPPLLEKIIRAVALQVGSEVVFNEVGQLCGCDGKTVEKYINLLEKVFVLFTLPAYARNHRNEIKKGKKVYFYDNGIRNAVLGNFTALESRTDAGALWENYLISERRKYHAVSGLNPGTYFWRTTTQQEVDYLELSDGRLRAWEMKWNPSKTVKLPLSFRALYPETPFRCVTRESITDFLAEERLETT